jgi:thiamine-phosphate pyrophosphorylase
VSAQTVEQALEAEQNGADYLGVGSIFTTSTKLDADDVSLETLRAICDAVSIPVVAIGGISSENLLQLKGTHIQGVAVVSAIFAAKNITGDTQKLLQLAKQLLA